MTVARDPPAVLGRRFEAVVIATPDDVLDADVLSRIHDARAVGVHVAVIASLGAEFVDALTAGEREQGALIVTDASGSETVVFGEGGSVEREGSRAPAVAALARVGGALVERLRGAGIDARVVTRAETVVELAVDKTAGDDGPDGVPPSAGRLGELAREVAFDAGLDAVGVTADGSMLRVRLRDDGRALRAVLDVLWARGVAPSETLLAVPVHEPFGDAALDDGFVALPVQASTPRGAATDAGMPSVLDVLDTQIGHRAQRSLPSDASAPGWAFRRDAYRAERSAPEAALFAVGDGVIGMTGAPLADAAGSSRWVLASGVYTDNGPETHLLTAPVAWHVRATIPEDATLPRVLNLRTGVLSERLLEHADAYRSVRFLSLARPGTAILRVHGDSPAPHGTDARGASVLLPPVNDDPVETGEVDGVQWMRVAGDHGAIAVAGTDDVHAATPGGQWRLDRFAAYDASPAAGGGLDDARRRLAEAQRVGFDHLLNEHRRAWARRWADADVVVEGDDDLQLAIRFALFHLIAMVPGVGEAAVGARGTSGPAYRGHVFWDADTFVLPFFAATHPPAARAMLEYRIRRLPIAIEAARRAGRRGARFPWESAASGADVTPTSARDRSGRVVPIRTGQLEDHIVAEVAWAACAYIDWTGDEEFARGPGVQLLVETARYWASRARVEPDGSVHVYGVIGPDEYHEPVDDSAFTNVMARWNLRRAVTALEHAKHDGISLAERRQWCDLADGLVDGYDPNTGIYEQFTGFHDLEPLLISEVAPRRPIAADLLLGSERVREAQITKQADVLMLHHLVPEETEPDSLEPNLRHYEPRTAHGSSLSPAVHASLFARARDFDQSLAALRIASAIDLEDLTGTTAGGLHAATMGGLWQVFAFGFAGLRPRDEVLRVDPRIPPAWREVALNLRFRASRVRVRFGAARLEIDSSRPITVDVGGEVTAVGPGRCEYHRRGTKWEREP